jgi:hypothetical protein
VLCEVASDVFAPCHDRLLSIFLEIDKEAETTAEERALRGVRKAQAKLATFYLLRGHVAHSREIYQDMAQESPERLRSIRDEMLGITSKQFWEVEEASGVGIARRTVRDLSTVLGRGRTQVCEQSCLQSAARSRPERCWRSCWPSPSPPRAPPPPRTQPRNPTPSRSTSSGRGSTAP